MYIEVTFKNNYGGVSDYRGFLEGKLMDELSWWCDGLPLAVVFAETIGTSDRTVLWAMWPFNEVM